MPSAILLGKDINGNVTYFLPISSAIRRTTLSAGTAQSLTIPDGCTSVAFAFANGTDVWVEYKNSTDATVPTGSFAASTSELNPVGRLGLTPGQTISFICPTTSYVCASFFA